MEFVIRIALRVARLNHSHVPELSKSRFFVKITNSRKHERKARKTGYFPTHDGWNK